jgi:3',5'-cyclic AMP phosphodiesterase CpdA
MKKLKSLIFFAFLTIPTIWAYPQQIARGTVYEDTNKNNKKDSKEKGIAQVAVSNGIDVVLTNAKGEYELPVGNDNIIFVITPGNYNVPVNQFNQPQSYYIHKPNGSPALKNIGLSPTGKLPKSIDFPLIPNTIGNEFRILVFGDPQPDNEKELDYFDRGMVKELEGVKNVEFGLSLGDLSNEKTNLYEPYKKIINKIGVPWYNVMGNHDENYDALADSLSDETFEREFGPANYSFNHGMVHFIILDDILYPDPRDGKGYWGGFREDQLKFIENDLKYVPKDYLIIFAAHIPISELEGGDPFRDEDRDRIFKLLKDFPYTLSLSAHTHFQSQDFLGAKEGWLQAKPHHHYNVGAACGDWYSGKLDEQGIPISTMRDGTPKGYAFLSFNKNKYIIDYKVAGKPADYRFELYAPKAVSANKWILPGICANFFMGSEYDTLFYRIDQGDWKRMFQKKDYDPSYYRIFQDWDYTDTPFEGGRQSPPEMTKHLWFASIPSKIEAGEHVIEVKVVDMFGRVFTQKKTYRIVKKE